MENRDNDSIRVFIALELPEPLKQFVTNFQQNLRPLPVKASWSHPSQAHLTLRFIGNIDPAMTTMLQSKVQSAVERFRSLHQHAADAKAIFLAAGGLGVFPSASKARILWTGIRGQTVFLESLHQIVNESLDTIDLKREHRRFLPHLTLARLKQRMPAKQVIRMVQKYGGHESGPAAVTKVCLFKSQLTPSGAEYSRLFKIDI